MSSESVEKVEDVGELVGEEPVVVGELVKGALVPLHMELRYSEGVRGMLGDGDFSVKGVRRFYKDGALHYEIDGKHI